jgi:type IV pilus assembly protein PilN
MIRVNLIGERKARKTPFVFGPAQRSAAACSAILVAVTLGIGWRYWSLSAESAALDRDLAAAQKESTRLHPIIAQVQQFEQRKAQLQQRVGLIEQLRKEQTGPVHLLDQLSRAMPPMLWLTELKQTAGANDVLIDGQCLTLTGLSDFVANLQSSGYFQRSVEIVNSSSETRKGAGELIKFQVKAVFTPPSDAAPAKAPGDGPEKAGA